MPKGITTNMNLEPNPTRLAQLNADSTSQRSWAWWVSVIITGVFIGNLLSFGAYQLYALWQLKQISIAFNAELDEQRRISDANRARIAERDAAAQKERQREESTRATLQQTCDFWQQQVRNKDTSENRSYRDVACARVKGLYR